MSSHRLPVEESLDRKLQGSRHFWASFFLRLRKTCRLGPRFCGFCCCCCLYFDYFVVVSYFRKSPTNWGFPKKTLDFWDPFLLRYAKNCAKHVLLKSNECSRGTSHPSRAAAALVSHPSCHFMPCRQSISNEGKSQPTKTRISCEFWSSGMYFSCIFLYEMSDVRTPENPQNHRFYTERLAPQPTAVLHCWPSLFLANQKWFLVKTSHPLVESSRLKG